MSASSYSTPLRLNLVLTRRIHFDFRGGASFLFILTAIRHRVSPEFIGSRNCVPMRRSPPKVRRHRASKPQGVVPVTGAALAGHHGPINMRLSFIFSSIPLTCLYKYWMLLYQLFLSRSAVYDFLLVQQFFFKIL